MSEWSRDESESVGSRPMSLTRQLGVFSRALPSGLELLGKGRVNGLVGVGFRTAGARHPLVTLSLGPVPIGRDTPKPRP